MSEIYFKVNKPISPCGMIVLNCDDRSIALELIPQDEKLIITKYIDDGLFDITHPTHYDGTWTLTAPKNEYKIEVLPNQFYQIHYEWIKNRSCSQDERFLKFNIYEIGTICI